ncbi:hypothetical protein ATANTOWER_006049 [Ataeniobius toweri]|uniref:Uncharacterized protein n=1 Tax=Ataeniobius toweri TaxID=208326 RepID=A0ABU7AME2_9TELE|nr:hypothetical protein [Ataeniobius toweri]
MLQQQRCVLGLYDSNPTTTRTNRPIKQTGHHSNKKSPADYSVHPDMTHDALQCCWTNETLQRQVVRFYEGPSADEFRLEQLLKYITGVSTSFTSGRNQERIR